MQVWVRGTARSVDELRGNESVRLRQAALAPNVRRVLFQVAERATDGVLVGGTDRLDDVVGRESVKKAHRLRRCEHAVVGGDRHPFVASVEDSPGFWIDTSEQRPQPVGVDDGAADMKLVSERADESAVWLDEPVFISPAGKGRREVITRSGGTNLADLKHRRRP